MPLRRFAEASSIANRIGYPPARLSWARRRTSWVFLLVFSLFVSALPLGGAKALAQTSGFRQVGAVEMGANTITSSNYSPLIIDPALDRGFMGWGSITGPTNVLVVDLSQLEIVDNLTIPNAAQGVDNHLIAVDQAYHRIFYIKPSPSDNCASTMRVLNTQTLTWSTLNPGCAPSGRNLRPEAMWYDPQVDRLYLIGFDWVEGADNTSLQFTPGHPFYLRRINATTGAADPGWENILIDPPCTTATTWYPHRQGVIRRFGDYLYFTCQTQTLVAKQGLLGKVRVDLSKPSPLDITYVPTLAGGTYSPFFDDASGQLLMMSSASANGDGVFVVDSPSMRFRGVVSTGGNSQVKAVGLDPGRGRLYMLASNRFIYSDIRHRPLPQGEPDPTVSGYTDFYYQIAVDPSRHRLLTLGCSTSTNCQRMLVWQDHNPETNEVASFDPDDATSDLAEAGGLTGASYSGSGNSFGALLLNVGGPTRMVDNYNPGCIPTFTTGCMSGRQPFLSDGSRLWFMGHVANLAVPARAAAGTTAVPLHLTDSSTSQDMQKCWSQKSFDPSAADGPKFCNYQAQERLAQHDQWPGGIAQCFDSGSVATGTATSKADVFCDTPNAVARASAAFGADLGSSALPLALPVKIAYAQSHVTSARDPAGGITTTATAVARGITIADTISIGEVRTEAVSRAAGRPDTAHATFTRSISGFSAPGFSCNDQCDPRQVQDAINKTLGFRVRVEIPVPEGQTDPNPCITTCTVKGTPKGFESLVTKEESLRVSELTVNDDPTDTVAGLEVIFYGDGSWGRARLTVQLAGVHAEAHYGIYCLLGIDDQGSCNKPLSVLPSVLGTDDFWETVTGSTQTDDTFFLAGSPPTPGEAGHISGPIGSLNKVADSITGFIRNIPEYIRRGWRFLVSHPGEAGMLAALLALLFSPAYLGLRRRSLLAGLATGR